MTALLVEPVASPEVLRKERMEPRQYLFLKEIGWKEYQTISNALVNRPGLRLTYDARGLEFMVTSSEHEVYKCWLSRLLDTLVEEFNLEVWPAGNMTFQREDLEKGMEPDCSFWLANESAMRGKLHWVGTQDPPPDLVFEIEVSRTVQDRLGILAALGIPEVWSFDGENLRIHVLQQDGSYQIAQRSPNFPSIPLSEIGQFLPPQQQGSYISAVKLFREWVRSHA